MYAFVDADFLHYYNLLVDMTNNRVVDATTHLKVQGILSQAKSLSPTFFCHNIPTHLYLLLPTVFQLYLSSHTIKHDVTHHLNTDSSPVHTQPHRLAPEKLATGRQEFEHMLEQGIIHPSSMQWSSPLFMVTKNL